VTDFAFWTYIFIIVFLSVSLAAYVFYRHYRLNREIKRRYEEDVIEMIKEKFRNPNKVLWQGSTKIRMYMDSKDMSKIKLEFQNVGDGEWKEVP